MTTEETKAAGRVARLLTAAIDREINRARWQGSAAELKAAMDAKRTLTRSNPGASRAVRTRDYLLVALLLAGAPFVLLLALCWRNDRTSDNYIRASMDLLGL